MATVALFGLGLVATVGWLVLATPAGQQAILGLVSSGLERTLGLGLSADQLRIGLVSGRISARGVRLYEPSQPEHPNLVIDDLETEVESWLSVLSPPIELRAVVAQGVQIDLAATLPKLPEDDEPTEPASGSPVEIETIRIDGIVVRGPVPGDRTTWLLDWGVDHAEISGGVTATSASVAIVAPIAVETQFPHLDGPDGWDGRLEVKATLDLAGPIGLDIERISLTGPGVDVSADATAALSEPAAAEGRLRASIDPTRWWPDLEGAQPIVGEGLVRLAGRELEGTISVRADGWPAELIDPFVAGTALAGLETTDALVTSNVDAEVAVQLDDGGIAANVVRGVTELRWARDGEDLVTATARAVDPVRLDFDGATRFEIEAELRPDLPSQQFRLEGAADFPGRQSWKETALDGVRVAIDIGDAGAFLENLWTPPDLVLDWIPNGELRGTASIQGPLTAPAGSIDMGWTLQGETIVELAGRTPPGSHRLELSASVLPETGDVIRLETETDPAREPAFSGTLEARLPNLDDSRRRLEARWPSLWRSSRELGSLPASIEAFLMGHLELEAAIEGPLTGPAVTADGLWRPDENQSIGFEASSRIAWASPFVQPGTEGRIELDGIRLESWVPSAEGEDPSVKGRLGGWVEGSWTDDGPTGAGELDLADGELPGGLALASAHIEATLANTSLTIAELRSELADGSALLPGAEISTAGIVSLDGHGGELDVRVDVPADGFDTASLLISVADGTGSATLSVDDLPGEASVVVPLGNLSSLVPALREIPWSDTWAEGPIQLGADRVDLNAWSKILLPVDLVLSVQGTAQGDLTVDLDRPAEAWGTIDIEGLEVVPEEGARIRSTETVRLVVADHRVTLEQLELRGEQEGAGLTASADVELNPEWELGDPIAELVGPLTASGDGAIDASIINPLLGGGLASGLTELTFEASNRSGQPEIDLALETDAAELFFPSPYMTRIRRPRLTLRYVDGVLTLDESTLELNRGEVTLSGSWDRASGSQLTASFEGVRYRVDYGLNVVLDGTLVLGKAPGQAPILTGQTQVRRGTLRRDIFLDRELLRSFSVGDASDTEGPLDDLRLDLNLTTREGVSLDNNLAELRIDWGTILVTGTLGQPQIAGRLESDPGGWLEVLGQLYRVDNLSIELFEDPSIEPEIEVETTSVLDDPTLYQQRREGVWFAGMNADSPANDLFYRERQHSSDAAMAQFTSGLATYFGDRLARAIGGGGLMQFSVQPLPLYGETSTDGRLTLTQRLGRFFTFIASSDTRQTEAQTYILEASGIIPRTKVQLFSNDEKNEGATAQIVGAIGARAARGGVPVLGEIEWAVPESIRVRRLRRGMSYREGDPFPLGSDFDVEIDIVEALHQMGFPGSNVSVTPVDPTASVVDLMVTVEPGPRVSARFEGLPVPGGFRDLITASYLPSEIDRGASLESVRIETERTLRRLGYLSPEVTVTEEPLEGVAFESAREIVVSSTAERSVEIESIRFTGLPAEDGALLAEAFDTTLPRMELAEGLGAADRRVERTATQLGYPHLEVVGRRLDEAAKELEVEVESGIQQTIASIAIEGIGGEDLDRLAVGDLPVEGTPARRGTLTSYSRAIVQALRTEGHPVATVEVVIRPLTPDEAEVDVKYVVRAGPKWDLAQPEFVGLKHTKLSFAEQLAALEAGEPFVSKTIGEGRRRLFRTTLFEAIDVRARMPDGALAAERDTQEIVEGDDATVTPVFTLEEGPRFVFSYGGRWERTKGASVIGDLIDRNFRGIGQTLGLRAVVGQSEQRLRLYYGMPRVPFPSSTSEIFLEGSRESRFLGPCDLTPELRPPDCDDDGGHENETAEFEVDELSARFQLTFPLNARTQIRPFLTITDRTSRLVKIDGVPVEPGEPRGRPRAIGDSSEDSDDGVLASSSANDDGLSDVVSPLLGFQLAYDTREGSLIAGLGEGMFGGLQLGGSTEELGSELTVLEIIAEAKTFKQVGRLGGGPMVWAQRLRIGTQITSSDQRVPVFDQFTAGGEFSLRGYPTESFGPGQAQLILNEELHFPVWPNLVSGLVFFDAGNVWRTADDAGEAFDLFTNVGLGLRFFAFRLDFAVPLDRRPDDPDYQLYFGFGNAF